MNSVLELQKLQKGRVVKIKSWVSDLSRDMNFYLVFVGFIPVALQQFEKLTFTGYKERDIFNFIFNSFAHNKPVFISLIGASVFDLDIKTIKALVPLAFNYPVTQYDFTDGRFINKEDVIDFIGLKISEKELDLYLTKCEMMANGSFPDLISMETLYEIIEKYYDSKEIKDVDTLVKNVFRTKKYKPMHFYLLKTEQTLRLYYCLCPTQKKDECLFLLMYNGKPTDTDREAQIKNILRNCRNKDFVRNSKKTRVRAMSDKELLEIMGIEAIPQSLDFSLYLTVKSQYWGSNTGKYVRS